MKRILIILVTIAAFFTFQSALKKYDNFILDRFISVSPNNKPFHFAVSGELDTGEIADFQKNLLQLLDKYELNCYQRFTKDQEYMLWTYTNDENYLNGIPLTEGVLSAIHPGDYYFSNDGNKKGVIFNPIRNKNYKIYHLDDFSSKYKSIFNPYELFTYESDAELVYAGFKAEFQELYPNMSIFSTLLDLGAHEESDMTIRYEDVIFSILTAAMVILVLNVIIIKQTKKIQILKLDGYSNWQIFRSEVLQYLGLIVLIQLIANVIMYFCYIETSLKNAVPFLKYLIAPNFIFILSLVILSVFSFTAILMIDINLAVKGKSSLKKQKNLNYAMKISLIVFTTLIVLNGMDYLKQYCGIVTTEPKYLNQVKNLYNATYVKPEYTGKMDKQGFLGKQKNVQDYLKKEHQFFELRHLEQVIIEKGKTNILVAEASKEYVNQYMQQLLTESINNGKDYVLIPKSLENQKERIYEELSQKVEYVGFDNLSLGDIVIYSQTSVNPFEPYDYIHYGFDISNAVLLVKDRELGSIGSHSYFRYYGDPSGVQEYFDNLCLHYQAKPYITIESIQEQYVFDKAFFIQEFKVFLPIFIMIILAIITNTYQLSVLNCEINDKKYAILKSEGRNTMYLIFDEVKVCIFLLFAAETVLYVFMNIAFGNLIFIIGIYFIMDLLLLWCTTGFRMKHFAERLR